MEEIVVHGNSRRDFLDDVWVLYKTTYSAIGMHINSASELLEYDRWVLLFRDERIIGFRLWRKTNFGWKAGLSGSDGSQEGKKWIVSLIRQNMKSPGFYGEVSHRVRDIALAAGVPVVCAVLAGRILGKQVEPVTDIDYQRQLGGLGQVSKTLVGRPIGVPVTSPANPQCPVVPRVAAITSEDDCTDDDCADIGSHLSCLVFDDLDSPELMTNRIAAMWVRKFNRV
jgi:hypothetical protein